VEDVARVHGRILAASLREAVREEALSSRAGRHLGGARRDWRRAQETQLALAGFCEEERRVELPWTRFFAAALRLPVAPAGASPAAR
jgi:hypothetical protein